jgi:DNA gyrase subunit A
MDESAGDEVIGMLCIPRTDTNHQILVVSEKGLGKRTPFLEKQEVPTEGEDANNIVEIPNSEGMPEKYELAYRVTNRGGKGVKTINITPKTGALVGLLAVEERDDLMITCKSGITIRMRVADIREAGRATQGVRLINIDEGDEIAAIARIAEQEVQGEEDAEAAHIIDVNPTPEA